MDTDAAEDLPPLAKALFEGDGLDEAHATMQSEMEVLSERVRLAVLKCYPKKLIGFLWGQLLMEQLGRTEAERESDNRAGLDDIMFALEYVHAVLSSHATADHGKSVATEDMSAVLQFSIELRQHALMYCMVTARRMPDGLFGPETGMVAMQAMTSWVTIRGHRYQALEAEFFEFVLEPHADALRAAYGVGAKEVATGIQAAVDATRYGHMQAADALEREANRAYGLAEKENIGLSEAIERIHGQDPMYKQVAQDAISGLLESPRHFRR